VAERRISLVVMHGGPSSKANPLSLSVMGARVCMGTRVVDGTKNYNRDKDGDGDGCPVGIKRDHQTEVDEVVGQWHGSRKLT
jgi:hypothetical protein